MGSKALRKQPLLSVVFPAHNAEEFVEKAIRSVAEQDYPNVEILLVDDASTDRTAYVAQKCNVLRHMLQKQSKKKESLWYNGFVQKPTVPRRPS